MGHSLVRAENKRMRSFEGVEYTGIQITWLAPNGRFIFALDKFKTRCGLKIERNGMWLFCPIRFSKLFNSLIPWYYCFGSKKVLDPIFPEFSTPHSSRLPFENIEGDSSLLCVHISFLGYEIYTCYLKSVWITDNLFSKHLLSKVWYNTSNWQMSSWHCRECAKLWICSKEIGITVVLFGSFPDE